MTYGQDYSDGFHGATSTGTIYPLVNYALKDGKPDPAQCKVVKVMLAAGGVAQREDITNYGDLYGPEAYGRARAEAERASPYGKALMREMPNDRTAPGDMFCFQVVV